MPVILIVDISYRPRKIYSPLQRGNVPPVLLSVSVSDNSGHSPQMSAPRRSCEIDQSTQRFHVGCDNRCGYKSRHPSDPG